MKKLNIFTYAVIALAVVLYALPAAATEPIQPLLAELTRPNAVLFGTSGAPALASTDEQATSEANGNDLTYGGDKREQSS